MDFFFFSFIPFVRCFRNLSIYKCASTYETLQFHSFPFRSYVSGSFTLKIT